MFTKGLVSIITPCYNVGNVIPRFLNSILAQTYNSIELITIDDGSTDNTRDVIESYRPLLSSKGIVLKYVHQQNKGLGGAIDTGLKHFTGEFLCWPDPDDFLMPDSIAIRKNFLDANPEYGIVRSDAFVFDEDDLDNPLSLVSRLRPDRGKEDLFEDYIRCHNVIFCSGCHMIRSSEFIKVNPTRSIYPSRYGQNWQMLLPMTYHRKFGFIDRPLYGYVKYKTSLSRSYDSFEKVNQQTEGFGLVLFNTLDAIDMPEDERRHWKGIAVEQIMHRRASDAWNYRRFQIFKQVSQELKDKDALYKIERQRRILMFLPPIIAQLSSRLLWKITSLLKI